MTAIANLPDLRPSLLLDFANSGRVDPRIQCTRASSATCFGPDGKLRTVAAGVPRIDYDPETGKCLGLLVEEARSNLRTHSRQPTASSGTVLGTSTAIAPDGLAVTSVEDDPATSSEHYVNDLMVAVTTGQVYTQSAFVKAMPGAERQVVLRVAGSVAGSQSLAFNVSDTACTATSAPSYPYGIQKCPNGWWRIWSQYTAMGDFATAVFRIQTNKNNAGIYQGEAGKGVFLFGRQIELGAFPTSYIPTEASAVTRAADLVVMKDLAWLSEIRGTFFIETLEQRAAASTGYFGIGRNSKSFEQRTSLYVSSSSSGIYSLSFCKEGVTQYSANVTTAAARRKLALGYEKDNARAAFNGTLMAGDSSFDPPSGYDAFGLGSVAGGWSGSTTPFLNGHVARFAFYPGRITDPQLQRLTA